MPTCISPRYYHRSGSSVETRTYTPERTFPSEKTSRKELTSSEGQYPVLSHQKRAPQAIEPSTRPFVEISDFFPNCPPSPTSIPFGRNTLTNNHNRASKLSPLKSAESRPSHRTSRDEKRHVPQNLPLPSSMSNLGPDFSFRLSGFAPRRPPSPPATPNTDKSFSLEKQAIDLSAVETAPPVPERSVRRSPPRSSSNIRAASISDRHLKPEPLRPRTSPAPQSSTFSITTGALSLNATASAKDLSGPLASSAGPEETGDADLESLPSTLDLGVLSWDDCFPDPPNLRRSSQNTRLISSRASSFDSAAPPPIDLGKWTFHPTTEADLAQIPVQLNGSNIPTIAGEATTPASPLKRQRRPTSLLWFPRPQSKVRPSSDTSSGDLQTTSKENISSNINSVKRRSIEPPLLSRRLSELPKVHFEKKRSWFQIRPMNRSLRGRQHKY